MALAGEVLSHQSWAQLWLRLRCECGAGPLQVERALQVAEEDLRAAHLWGVSSHSSIYTKAKVITKINGFIIIIIVSFIHSRFSTSMDKGSILS